MDKVCIDCSKSISSRSTRCNRCNALAQWAAKDSTLRAGVERGWEQGHYSHVVACSVTEDAIAKQSESMKRKWAEDAEYAKLVGKRRMEELVKPEIRAKISAGVTRSWADPELRQRRLAGIIKGDNLRRSKLEYEVSMALDKLSLGCKPQFRLRGLNRFYDFCIPDLKLLIEVDGEYWHHSAWAICNGQEFIDEEKNRWALANGYSIIRLREYYLLHYGVEALVNSALIKLQSCQKRPIGLKYSGNMSGLML